jgi:alpha,alpha-trehalase
LIVKTTVNYNGIIPEKFNPLECTHNNDGEYGNFGIAFKYITDGGFGWKNTFFKKK